VTGPSGVRDARHTSVPAIRIVGSPAPRISGASVSARSIRRDVGTKREGTAEGYDVDEVIEGPGAVPGPS
jgi:hypothetical protein